MKNYGIVHGGAEQAVPLVVGKDTVYVHTNITKLEPDPNDEFAPADLYSYEEVQYDKDEYIGLISNKNDVLEVKVGTQDSVINELMFEIIPTMIGGGV